MVSDARIFATATPPALAYFMISRNNSAARSSFIAAHQRMLPDLQIFPAIDGFDKML